MLPRQALPRWGQGFPSRCPAALSGPAGPIAAVTCGELGTPVFKAQKVSNKCPDCCKELILPTAHIQTSASHSPLLVGVSCQVSPRFQGVLHAHKSAHGQPRRIENGVQRDSFFLNYGIS